MAGPRGVGDGAPGAVIGSAETAGGELRGPAEDAARHAVGPADEFVRPPEGAAGAAPAAAAAPLSAARILEMAPSFTPDDFAPATASVGGPIGGMYSLQDPAVRRFIAEFVAARYRPTDAAEARQAFAYIARLYGTGIAILSSEFGFDHRDPLASSLVEGALEERNRGWSIVDSARPTTPPERIVRELLEAVFGWRAQGMSFARVLEELPPPPDPTSAWSNAARRRLAGHILFDAGFGQIDDALGRARQVARIYDALRSWLNEQGLSERPDDPLDFVMGDILVTGAFLRVVTEGTFPALDLDRAKGMVAREIDARISQMELTAEGKVRRAAVWFFGGRAVGDDEVLPRLRRVRDRIRGGGRDPSPAGGGSVPAAGGGEGPAPTPAGGGAASARSTVARASGFGGVVVEDGGVPSAASVSDDDAPTGDAFAGGAAVFGGGDALSLPAVAAPRPAAPVR